MNFTGQAQATTLLALLLGVVIALIAAPLLLRAYARSLDRNMRAASAGVLMPILDETLQPAENALRLKLVSELRSDGLQSSSAEQQRRSTVWAYMFGGVAFGAVATVLLFFVQGIEFLPLRTVTVVASYSSPIVIVLGLIYGNRSWPFFRSAILYVAALTILGALNAIGTSEPISNFAAPFALWLFYGLPSVLLLLLLNRRLRSIAPVIFIVASMAVIGVLVAPGLLEIESIFHGVTSIGFSLGLGGVAIFTSVCVLGMAALGWIGFKLAAFLARRFDQRELSEEGLIIDGVWLFQTMIVSWALEQAAILALLAFAAYKMAASYLIKRSAGLAEKDFEPALLMLRVFGFDARSSALLDDLTNYWSYQGPIQLIAAPDLASRIIDHSKLLLFLAGRLDHLFLRNRDDLEHRLTVLRSERDPDGRFRIEPFYCQGDVWRQTVKELMVHSHLVVMDLRGFDKERSGCIFEIEVLLDIVPIHRILLLIDDTTSIQDLREILDSKWRKLAVTSPNIKEEAELLIFEIK